jgi:hypothetical protein
MVITSRWLRESTKGGSPTKAQLEVLGHSWPPITGWMERLIGVEISEQTASRFIDCQYVKLRRRREMRTVLPVEKEKHWKFCPHCGKEL